jgi:hypothetical protein
MWSYPACVGLAVRREDCFSRGAIAIRRRPSAVWVVAVFISGRREPGNRAAIEPATIDSV